LKRKKGIKKPPSGQTEGGLENELSGNVFFPNNNINPAYCQIDFTKLADALELHAEVYRLRADEARLLAIIMAGGTIYPI
jgi:hypothetical protein